MKTRYVIMNRERAKRLLELADTDNPNDLEAELAVARLLQEEALNAGDTETSIKLLPVIGKLSQISDVSKFRRSELLTKATVLGIAGRMVDVLTLALKDKFPGWENSLETVQQDLLTIVCEAKNEEETCT